MPWRVLVVVNPQVMAGSPVVKAGPVVVDAQEIVAVLETVLAVGVVAYECLQAVSVGVMVGKRLHNQL